ncbi:4Fe-4S binding protein [Spongiivirga sp. MCCC 1A20706]|uniref:4Fe-4S binding protein n=1 Tax=Spongiivirga sp. MCCC 1A20706 TaxID=3160963 RepID=UPI0039777BD4
MKTSQPYHFTTAYEAVASIAYKTNEVFPIYPCTPTSEMSALVEEWSSKKKKNLQGAVPSVFEMQSESGVAGTMHGALLSGTLSSTFTASQGLLLMIPAMYRIAGELLPNVIHVATRSIATHALSIFGDHSDVMAARQTGYAFLSSASVQEAQDFALIAKAASLNSRVPFVHFFDGFRTSHEKNCIQPIDDHIISQMIDHKLIEEHRNRALNNDNPSLRGTTQGPDVFFQSREAQNIFHNLCPTIVQDTMDQFTELTGRRYKLFDYVGNPEAENVIVTMASSSCTVEKTISYLNAKGFKLGLIKVRLFRPFSKKHLLNSLPKTVKSIAVLDRTKEPGAAGEPLYLDIVQSLTEAFTNDEISHLPRVVGGRYGLSSKEFTPNMAVAIFDNLTSKLPKNSFTVGIEDDITDSHLNITHNVHLEKEMNEILFFQYRSAENTESIDRVLTTVATSNQVQMYTEFDYKKYESREVVNLRIDSKPVSAPYTIASANIVCCEHDSFIIKDIAVERLAFKASLVVLTEKSREAFWNDLPAKNQRLLIAKEIKIYIIKSDEIKEEYIFEGNKITALHAFFLNLTKIKTNKVDYFNPESHRIEIDTAQCVFKKNESTVQSDVLNRLMSLKGNEITTSELPFDGTYPTNTSSFNEFMSVSEIPVWNPEICIQCGACSLACPQGAIRAKVFDNDLVQKAPVDFESVPALDAEFDLLNFTIQVHPDQCNGCNQCIDACPVKNTLKLESAEVKKDLKRENWDYFNSIPEIEKERISISKLNHIQLIEPLFKYSSGVKGCGSAPYLKLLSQLYGERLLVANATGASSIFGGALPTTPWSTNKDGVGPAWANSLFENNAEFGLGFGMATDFLNRNAGKKKKSTWIVGGDGWAYDIGYGGLDHVLASGANVNILVLDNEVYDNTGGQMSKATPYGATTKFAYRSKQGRKKDLGLLAMQYEDVYVASVAIGADQEQTLKAFIEAENYEGPSLIIAYCHSESHGIDMRHPSKYHKAAVESGQWLLYRFNPSLKFRDLNPLRLDSQKPKIPVIEYLKQENRFQNLFKRKNGFNTEVFELIQNNIDRRYNKFNEMSLSNLNYYSSPRNRLFYGS